MTDIKAALHHRLYDARMTQRIYRDRIHAGEVLADILARKTLQNPVVLALPRGGVPLAAIVAEKLDAPLDVILVRKVGSPKNKEVAAGAVVDGTPPVVVFNRDVMRHLQITESDLADTIKLKIDQINDRRALYFADAKPLFVRGKTAIIVDDGMATGATALAAARGLRKRHPMRIILAVPVASKESLARLAPEVDEIICPLTPEPFYAVGVHYAHFGQTSDDEVVETLRKFRDLPISR